MCNQHIDKKCNKCGWGLPLMHSLKNKKKSNNKRKFVEEQVAPEETRVDDIVESSSTDVSNSSNTLSISEQSSEEQHSETVLVEPPKTPTRSTSFKKRPWKEIYAERLVVERNWRKGAYSVRDFTGHTDAVMCLQFDEHSRRLVTGSFDTTLRVWDTDSDSCIAVLKGHTAVIRAVQFDDCKIVSGSMDSTIRIWNAQTFECIRVLTGHTQGVTCLDFHEKLLVSGSVDGSIKVWDLGAGCVFRLAGGHRDWVNCVKIVNKRLIASSSDDATLKIWDIDSKSPIMTFSGHIGYAFSHAIMTNMLIIRATFSPIQKFKILLPYLATAPEDETKVPPGKVVTASLDNTGMSSILLKRSSVLTCDPSIVKVWDLATGGCLQTLFGHTEGVWCVSADSLRVVSGSHDKRIMMYVVYLLIRGVAHSFAYRWDSVTGTSMYSLTGHKGSVNCCQLSDSGVFSGDETGVVKFWNYLPDDFPYKRDSPSSLKSV
jgi:F-box/WD-40 domain protein MET30